MKFKITLFIAMFFSIAVVFGQKNTAELVSSNKKETILKFKINYFDFKDVTTPNGIEKILVADNLTSLLKKGFPNLPKFTKSIIIPDFGKTKIEVISYNFYEIEDVKIAPSKGSFTRNVDPSTVPFEYGKAYKTNEFFPNTLAGLGKPYIARDFRGQAVNIYPFSYNPIRKTLRVYTDVTVKISSVKEKGINEFARTKTFNKIDREYKNIYSSHFINYASSKYTPVEEDGNMLIICYDDWTAEMQPLVDWKNKIGRHCEMVTVTDAGGTAANIKTYVENYYNTNGLTYLLLVGDVAQVPTNSGAGLGGDSDNAYAYVVGNDHYLDFFVGRFSAESTANVSTQVQRTITYENGSTLENGWLNKTMGVASGLGAGSGDDGEADYVHVRNMQADLTGFTYVTPTVEQFDGSQGGNDAAGDPTGATVSTELNTGVGNALYCGHGGDFSWVSSGFDVSDINNLTNDNKLPYIFDVACVNGNFVGQTCFGEAWLRAENAGQPTGAIAIVASTINQDWAQPMVAQDEMVDLVVGASTNGTKRTFAGIAVNGMFLMNDETSDFNMTDTWTTFGDPSVLIRTDNPVNMAVSHSSTIIMGTTEFAVNCDFEGALACLSFEGNIIGTASVSGGVANVPVTGLTPGQVVDVAVTGFNKVTYISTATVIAPSGPYIVVDNATINGNTSLDFAQTGNIDITLKNVGPESASGITATLTTTDEYVTSLTNNTDINFGAIAGDNGTAVSSGSFSITLANNVPNQHVVSFDIVISDGSKTTWNGKINILANAPTLSIGNVIIDDSETGNNDGILDPNETANIIVGTSNDGHADVSNVIGNISIAGNNLVINSATTSPYNLNVNENGNAVFNVTANDVEVGTTETLNITITAGADNQYSANKSQDIVIGFVPDYGTPTSSMEDEYIENVQFIDIDNSSDWGNNGYSDYSETISTDVEKGQTYPITVNVGDAYDNDAITCWVDWNYNGSFTDAGEEFVLEWNKPVGTGNIVVPADVNPRSVRMRIRLVYNNVPEPTGNTSYGETEDYTLNIVSPISVSESNNNLLNIYPNPTNGLFTVVTEDKGSKIEIYSVNGQLVYTEQASSLKTQIDLSNLVKGIYFIKVSSENGVANSKIVFK